MREQLEKERKLLRSELDKVDARLDAIKRKELAPVLVDTFVGKFFKSHNTYGGTCKGWWLYHYVISLSGKDFNLLNPTFKTLSFQITSDDRVEFRRDSYTYQSALEQEIPRSEFMRAYRKALGGVNDWFPPYEAENTSRHSVAIGGTENKE